ncbi:MAG: hypothetical protein GY953_05840 [bacterium]|nr:hypothetical protein [bacterium]
MTSLRWLLRAGRILLMLVALGVIGLGLLILFADPVDRCIGYARVTEY